jgi:hypothetical protein
MTVQLAHLGPQRAAHDEPHDEFDPLAPRFAQIVDVRHVPQSSWVGGELVEEGRVPLLVDQPGARPLELVAHPARSPDLHVEILGVARHRPRDRLAEQPAAVARRRRIGDDIDRDRHDLDRPRIDLPEHQRHRHGQPVIDRHRVDDRHVEFVEDAALRDVPGEIGVPLHFRHRARPPALVGDREAVGAADREGRDEGHVERRGVVVIDQDHDIGFGVALIGARKLVAGEDRLPIGLVRLPVVHRRADRGDVARRDACGDAGHVSSPPSAR